MSQIEKFSESVSSYHNPVSIRMFLLVVIGVSGFNLLVILDVPGADPSRVYKIATLYALIGILAAVEPFAYAFVETIMGDSE